MDSENVKWVTLSENEIKAIIREEEDFIYEAQSENELGITDEEEEELENIGTSEV